MSGYQINASKGVILCEANSSHTGSFSYIVPTLSASSNSAHFANANSQTTSSFAQIENVIWGDGRNTNATASSGQAQGTGVTLKLLGSEGGIYGPIHKFFITTGSVLAYNTL